MQSSVSTEIEREKAFAMKRGLLLMEVCDGTLVVAAEIYTRKRFVSINYFIGIRRIRGVNHLNI